MTDVTSLAILSVIFNQKIRKRNTSGLVENRIQTPKLNFSNGQSCEPLSRGFIIRYGNVTELNHTYPHLKYYTLNSLVLDHQTSNNGGISKIRAGIDLMQNARIILCTAYIAKDLKNIVKAGAVLLDEAGLVGLDEMGTIFSSVRENNGKVIVIGVT